MTNKIFEKFKVKDIVFLAIISAVALCTAAVMAVVSHIYIFGLAQLVTAFQFSFFLAIALMKESFQVRKPLYPLLSIFISIMILTVALIFAKDWAGIFFIPASFALLCFTGYWKCCIKVLPWFF
jgi:predicted neutral ceramidase superfamily lipid hydrolase